MVSYISKVSPNVLFSSNKPFSVFFAFEEIKYFSQAKSRLNSFYISDSITKNSKIMSLCSSRFKSLSYNFL
jgi:hypothetical protein